MCPQIFSICLRNHNELWKQDKIMITQQNALDELKKENVSLYEAAIQFDPELIPMSFKGPVTTPPIENYIQDGEYKDTTQSFKVCLVDYTLNLISFSYLFVFAFLLERCINWVSFQVIYEDTDAFMKELLQRNRKRKKKTEEEE